MMPTRTIAATMISTITHVSLVPLSLDRLVCPGRSETRRELMREESFGRRAV
jgi:hypothetical protein